MNSSSLHFSAIDNFYISNTCDDSQDVFPDSSNQGRDALIVQEQARSSLIFNGLIPM